MADWPSPSRWIANLWALLTSVNHGVGQDEAIGNAHVLKEIIGLAEECDVSETDRRRWATDGFEAIIGDFLPRDQSGPQDQPSPPTEPPALPPGRPPPELPPGPIDPDA